MREAFRVCDLEMAPYVETAREFCDVDGGAMTGGGGGTNAEAGSDGMQYLIYQISSHLLLKL